MFQDYDVDYESISDAADEDYLLPLSKRLKQKKTKKKGNYKTKKPSNPGLVTYFIKLLCYFTKNYFVELC